MFDSAAALLPASKRTACEKSWAGPFREKALPILLRAEQEFAEFYDDETGRPNRPVALVLGTLVLKEANDLTDEEALGAGDVILAAILGLFLGWPIAWFGLLLGILLGGAISILLLLGLLVSGQYKEKAWMVFIPYGPYFLLSAFLILYLPTWVKAIVPK